MKIEELNWEKSGGLVPAIVQDSSTGRVLMLAYMNREALARTLDTKLVCFWSRSRKELWTKGETSGNYLHLQEIAVDCDGDTLLVLADPQGPACHQGSRSCFLPDEKYPALEFLGYLERLIRKRERERPEGSYTTSLFEKGMSKVVQKVGEEAVEVVVSASEEKQRSVEEVGDLIYHLLVFLALRGLELSAVVDELRQRHDPPA